MPVEPVVERAEERVILRLDWAGVAQVSQLLLALLKYDLIPESCGSAAIDLIEGLRDRAREERAGLKR